MINLIEPIAETMQFNTTMVGIVMEDTRPEDGLTSVAQSNPLNYLVGHLLSTRYDAAKIVGLSVSDPWQALYGGNTPYDRARQYPAISELAPRWRELNEKFFARLDELSAEDVMAEVTSYPFPDKTVRGALSFISWHESYHVGQMGTLRRALGYRSNQQAFYDFVKAQAA